MTSLVFVLANHNLTSAATVTLALHRSNSWGSPSVTETLVYFKGDIIHVLGAVYSFAWAQLSITDAANPDGYIEFGLADLWHGVSPTRAVDLAGTPTVIHDPSTVVETPHGDIVARSLTRSESASAGWTGLHGGEAYYTELAARAIGDSGYGILITEPTRELYSRSAFGTAGELPARVLTEPSGTFPPASG